MLTIIAKASAKSVATFLVLILFYMTCITIAPLIIISLQDIADNIEGQIRTPEFLDSQKLFVWRIITDGNVIMGVFTTLIARLIVEIGASIFGAILSKKSDDQRESDDPDRKFDYNS